MGNQGIVRRLRWIDCRLDVWPVFADPDALAILVAGIVAPFRDADVTAVCGIEARGFLLGGAAAVELGTGFVPIRKSDVLFAGEKISRTAHADYNGVRHELHVQRDALGPGDRVLLVDDWLHTGSQALAAKAMIAEAGAELVGCSVMAEELPPAVRVALGRVEALLEPEEIPLCDCAVGEGSATAVPQRS